jgi:hypothetical protein
MCEKDGLEEIIESLGVDPTRLEYSQEANRACLVAETYLTINAIADFLDEVYFQEDHPYQPDQRAASRLSELREILCGLTLLDLYTASQHICYLILRDILSGPDGRFRLSISSASEIAVIVSRFQMAEIESGWGEYAEGWVETNDNKTFFHLVRKALGEDREKRLKEWVKEVKKDCSWFAEGFEEQE